MSMSRALILLALPVLAGALLSCASNEVASGGEDETAPGMGEAPRRAVLPSYLSPEVTRGRLEGIDFGDTVWEIPELQKEKVKAVALYLKVRAERVIVAGARKWAARSMHANWASSGRWR